VVIRRSGNRRQAAAAATRRAHRREAAAADVRGDSLAAVRSESGSRACPRTSRPTGRTAGDPRSRGPAPELAVVRHEYNTVCRHAGIGYVTAAEDHDGRGPGIRAAGKRGVGTPAGADRRPSITASKANRRSPADEA
jgi:hypothetical protein